jgi:hypothetical protein
MPRGSWILAVVLLSGAGCSRGSGNDEPPSPSEVMAETPVAVRVVNNHALPVEIYAVGSSIRHRLGTVHPGMRGEFTLPRNLVGSGSVEFQASVTGQDTYRSGPLIPSPGAIVDVRIAPQLFNSTAQIIRP